MVLGNWGKATKSFPADESSESRNQEFKQDSQILELLQILNKGNWKLFVWIFLRKT